MFQLEELPNKDVFSGHAEGVPVHGSNIATWWFPASCRGEGGFILFSWPSQAIIWLIFSETLRGVVKRVHFNIQIFRMRGCVWEMWIYEGFWWRYGTRKSAVSFVKNIIKLIHEVLSVALKEWFGCLKHKPRPCIFINLPLFPFFRFWKQQIQMNRKGLLRQLLLRKVW